MKILQLIGNSAYGGATNIVIDISDALSDEFDVVIMANDKDTKLAFEKRGYKVYKIDSMCREINPIKDLLSVIKLRKFVKDNKIDVIHSHTSKGGAYSRLLKVICSVKVVHTVHGFPFEYDEKFTNKLFRKIEKVLSQLSDYITFVNEKDFKYAIENYKKDKLRLILNGVDEKNFYKNEKHTDDITIGIVARVVKQKGFDDFFSMVKELQSNKKLKFKVIGIGPELEYYKNYVKINSLNVEFLGFRKDVNKLIANWDIFVLPSWREGLPISVMEAMASSLPCVVTDIRGNNELVTDGVNGYLFDIMDTDSLIESIKKLINKKDTRDIMGFKSRSIIEQKYTKSEMMFKYKELFKFINSSNIERKNI